MGVVTPLVVEDDGDFDVGPLRLLPLEVETKVAFVLCRTAVAAGEVVMVADHMRSLLTADVTGGDRGKVELVDWRHHHRDGAVDRGVDETVLVLQRLEEVVDDVGTAVHRRCRLVAGVVADDVIAIPRRFMLLVAASVRDMCIYRLYETLKIGIYNEGGAQLVVLMVGEEAGVFPARHLDPLRTVGLAVWHMFHQEVSPTEHVQAVDAREADSIVSGARGDEAAQVLNQAVVSPLTVGE